MGVEKIILSSEVYTGRCSVLLMLHTRKLTATPVSWHGFTYSGRLNDAPVVEGLKD